MTRFVPDAERRARLALRHRLLPTERTDDPVAVADSLVALHSTDPASVHLSATARLREPSVAAVERALYDDRTLVRHHAMRRTLWVATPGTVRLMHHAATVRLVGPERRRTLKLLAANGVADPEGWVAEAREKTLAALHEHGALTARELGERVPALRHPIVMAPGKPYSATVSAHTRVLLELGFAGEVLRTRPAGTWINGAYAYAAADTWLPGGLAATDGDGAPLTERQAAARLALRWLRAFGPGTAADLQWWAGWTAATTRAALADSGAVEVRVGTGPAYVAPGDEEPVERDEPWVALLPGLDPTTMGWKERAWYLPDASAAVFDRMGNAGPTVWVDGQVAGAWVQAPDGEIRSELTVELPPSRRRQVAEEAERLAAVVGDTRFTVRFPSPLSTALYKA